MLCLCAAIRPHAVEPNNEFVLTNVLLLLYVMRLEGILAVRRKLRGMPLPIIGELKRIVIWFIIRRNANTNSSNQPR